MSISEISPKPSQLTTSNNLKLIIGIAAGVFVAFAGIAMLVFRQHKKGYKKKVYLKIEKDFGITLSPNNKHLAPT